MAYSVRQILAMCEIDASTLTGILDGLLALRLDILKWSKRKT